MAKPQAVLNYRHALNVKEPGLYRDSDGLYLQVTPVGVKSWIVRYMMDGRPRYMGIGPFPAVSLSDARDKAIEIRRHIRLEGSDPLELKATQKLARRLERAKSISFKACAEAFIAANRPSWKNAKHIWQWTRSLELYIYPVFGDMSIAEVDTALVVKALEAIWITMTETASRLRGSRRKDTRLRDNGWLSSRRQSCTLEGAS